MPAFEKKFLLWVEKHLFIIAGAVISLLAVGLRLALKSLYTTADGMADNTITMWSGFVTAGVAAYITAKNTRDKGSVKPLAVYGVLLLSPAGLFSTVIFGNFGELSVTAAVMALYLYGCKRYLFAYLFLALSCLLGIQGLFLLPVFLLLCIRDEEHDLLYFLFPVLTAGARFAAELGGCSFFGPYLPQGFSEKRLYTGFPSFWAFLNDRAGFPWEHYAVGTALVCLVVLTGFMVFFAHRSRQTERWLLALCCAMLVTEFLPGLDPTAASVTLIVWLAVAEDGRLIIPAVLLELIGLFPLAAAVYGEEWLPLSVQWLSVIRFFVWIALLYLAGTKKKLDEKQKV